MFQYPPSHLNTRRFLSPTVSKLLLVVIFCSFLWPFEAFCGLLWPFEAFCGIESCVESVPGCPNLSAGVPNCPILSDFVPNQYFRPLQRTQIHSARSRAASTARGRPITLSRAI